MTGEFVLSEEDQKKNEAVRKVQALTSIRGLPPPTPPNLSIDLNGAETGIIATIAGSDAGTRNTLYVSVNGGITWTEVDDRVGDGEIEEDPFADGDYWFYVETSGPGGFTVSNLVWFSKLDTDAKSTFYRVTGRSQMNPGGDFVALDVTQIDRPTTP